MDSTPDLEMPPNLPQIKDIKTATTIIATLLTTQQYAIIGSAALIALGMTIRSSRDIDILVKPNSVTPIKSLLSTHPSFTLNPRTRHLTYIPTTDSIPLEIDVLTPFTARMPFEDDFPVYVTGEGVKIGAPWWLLEYKIGSAYSRPGLVRKRMDWSDVVFLIKWHGVNGVRIEGGKCGNANYQALLDLREYGFMVEDSEWEFIGGILQ